MYNKNFLEGFELKNKTVFISGASSGIGEYLSELFLAAGAHLIITSREYKRAEQARQKLLLKLEKKSTQIILALALDAGNSLSINEALTKSFSHFKKIDVLINNAGMADKNDNALAEQNIWNKIIDINLNGARLLSQKVAEHSIENKYLLSIINIASIAGLQIAGNASAYSVSKAALIHLSKSMALELARYNIRVNCIAPGYIRTPLNNDFLNSKNGSELIKRIPQRRLGEFDDIAVPILTLASRHSSYMTGSVVTIDGGHLCRSL